MTNEINYWMIATGGMGELWKSFQENKQAFIGFSQYPISDLKTYKNVSQIPAGKGAKKYIWQFGHEIKIGDIIIAKKGVKKILAIGKVTKTYYYIPEKDDWKHCIDVDWLRTGLWEMVQKTNRNTVHLDKNSKRIEQYKSILDGTYDNMNNSSDVNDYKDKLENSKNLILRGAPGTGKTYLAKQIAEELTDGNEDQIGFVQFHPSYDYTDFVEGLRPSSGDDGQIGFELQDGIFREFCKKAKKATESGGQDNFDEAWDKFFEAVNDVDPDGSYDIKTLTGKPMHLIAYMRNEMSGVMEKGSASLFYNKAQCYNIYKGDSGVPKGGLDNYRKAVVKHLKEKYGLVDYVKPTETTTDKNFVFIIDEINRGEISKIFGELFFSIDPDYRGKDGKVTTQYANLRETDKEFYIPENVYIIGTMNDIDRSVDTFDFAMRRRFRFVEIKAADTMGMWENNDKFDNDKIEEARIRLTNLNKAISNTEGLNSHYHIGPSYFLKLKDLDYDYDILWSDYLEPLLKDYLRGSYDETDSLDKLKDAYNNEEETDETH
ncbi:AAA family ATPase [Streptococcus mutans]|uniref:AAA family ATPase n=1 Tax=Streptococcus mutans TaxID=1309 RepID=UPI0002B5A70C|nr:AAA family ATPase [Streptococcus mutans]EMC19287.1 putative endonuclease [Streptococcus mutans NV1996]EMC30703.1 putative endonuclease [Streptococcus mutans U2A]EMC58548.1 putative endonuclease [Streptococcus mutans OMZ175]QFG45139.1 ATPase associated with various cellular activities family protein [Streptococcus mutans]QZS43492.1 AAA family ATPase [Streptococcus mutans OMZ175]